MCYFFDKNEFKAASHPKANLRLQLMQQRITQGCSVPPGAGA
jgi:hypothetical protein